MSGIKYIHLMLCNHHHYPSTELLPSCKTNTLHPLNVNSPFCPPPYLTLFEIFICIHICPRKTKLLKSKCQRWIRGLPSAMPRWRTFPGRTAGSSRNPAPHITKPTELKPGVVISPFLPSANVCSAAIQGATRSTGRGTTQPSVDASSVAC